MDLVETHKERYGLNACCEALSLSKSTLHHRRRRPDLEVRDAPLKADVVSIIRHHPGYGYRRILKELAAQDRIVNHKRLRNLLSTYALSLPRHLPSPSVNSVLKLIRQVGDKANLVAGRTFDPLCAFCTDFTELIYDQGRKKAWLMALLDIPSRFVGGYALGATRNRSLAFECLDHLSENLTVMDRTLKEILIHHDRDSVYTSHDWLHRLLLKEGTRISFAMKGARDNPWIESFWGRFKVENESLIFQAQTLEELWDVVCGQMAYYNQDRRHSALSYQTPLEVLTTFLTGEKSRLSLSAD